MQIATVNPALAERLRERMEKALRPQFTGSYSFRVNSGSETGARFTVSKTPQGVSLCNDAYTYMYSWDKDGRYTGRPQLLDRLEQVIESLESARKKGLQGS